MEKIAPALCLLLVLAVVALAIPGISWAMAQVPALPAMILPAPLLSPISAQSSDSFQATLEELGYDEKVLDSPWDTSQYSFRLPDNWWVEDGSYLDLEFSYFYNIFEPGPNSQSEWAYYGELLVYLDDELLTVYPLDDPNLERAHLKVDLPADLLNEEPGTSHAIRIELDASFLCKTLHKAHTVIHSTSTLFLNYTLLPPNLDLANYPRPFYQHSFEPDRLHFVLPAQPSEAEMHAAAMIAARLSELTNGNMVISATTDVEFMDMANRERASLGHLFVLGRPDRNLLLPWLNDHQELPVPALNRKMALHSQGPTAVAPGETISYTIMLTNTTSEQVDSLVLTDRLPRRTILADCRPACTETDGEVHWKLDALDPGEAISFSLVVQLDAPWRSHPLQSLENMVILADEKQTLWNTSSLTTVLDPSSETGTQSDSAHRRQTSSAGPDAYFFVWDGQPVSEGDGVLQEIVSPWSPEQVILLISGARDDSVHKASQALSLGTRLPEMEGATALVREVHPAPVAPDPQALDLTLADLGYTDETLYGVHSQEMAYWFFAPWTWQLSEAAYFRLLFSHSGVIDEQTSALTILLNDTPLTSVALDRENAQGGDVTVSLPDSRVRRGSRNKISLQVWMQPNKDECDLIDARQIWLNVFQDSALHLAHREQAAGSLDLKYYPFPFDTLADLGDVLFVLPKEPGQVEQESLLWLAAILGNSAGGAGFSPKVSLSGKMDPEMLSRHHIIFIGRPSTLPLIQEINPLLPQPFISGTDEVEYQVGEVLLRMQPDASLGYIQELPSPWNEDRAILVVTGTTDEGVAWAADRLTRRLWELEGNLVLVYNEGDDIQPLDTRKLTQSGVAQAMTTAVPDLVASPTVTPTLEPEPTASPVPAVTKSSLGSFGRPTRLPSWVMLLSGAAMVIVVSIFGVASWQARRR